MSSPTNPRPADDDNQGPPPDPSRGRVGPSVRGIGDLWHDEAGQKGIKTTSNCAHVVLGGGGHHEPEISSIGDDAGRGDTSLSNRTGANHPVIASQAYSDVDSKGKGVGRIGCVDSSEFVAQAKSQSRGRRDVCKTCKPAGNEGDKGKGIAVESAYQGANLWGTSPEKYVIPVLHAQIGIGNLGIWGEEQVRGEVQAE
ncbi:hypothetical protein ACHAXT_013297 [Thalassiosira profunda]